MRIARDILTRKAGEGFDGWLEAKAYVEQILADPDVTNADLKGLVKRLVGPAWGVEFDFGADAKAARRYLEALSRAIAQELT
jgi:hypothetical protein